MSDFFYPDGYGYVFRKKGGLLLSSGKKIRDPLPPSYGLYVHPQVMDASVERWDAATTTVVSWNDVERADQLDLEASELTARAALLRGA